MGVGSGYGNGVRTLDGGVIGSSRACRSTGRSLSSAKKHRKAKFMGVVLVGLIVDKNGLPQSVNVIREWDGTG